MSRTLERTLSVGIIGARGYAGGELLRLLEEHRGIDVAFASSRSGAGEPVDPARPYGRRFEHAAPDTIGELPADAYVLALPHGASVDYVAAINRAFPGAVIVDLSADHRFDPAWVYGLTERNRASIATARRIANPGCYATAMQIAALPVLDDLASMPHFFGVSGYSGAGVTPSPKNDPDRLRDGILPYSLVDHRHQAEVSEQLGRPVRFVPHVAPFFRGISVTSVFELSQATTLEELLFRYADYYANEPGVTLVQETPLISQIAGRTDAVVGGIEVDPNDGRQVAVVCTIDNLLKGAASQALQNLNLALGFQEREGLQS